MNPSTSTSLSAFTLGLLLALLPLPVWASSTTHATPQAETQAETQAVPQAATQQLWQPPLGAPLRVSVPYDLANGPYQAGHRGIDMRATSGTTVASPASGVVTFVGRVVDRSVISIRIDGSTVVSLEPVASELAVGSQVQKGQALGPVESGGHCASSCLHLGVRIEGTYVNPLRFFISRAVLVPW